MSSPMDRRSASSLSPAEELVNKLKALDCKLSMAGDRLVRTPGSEQIPPLLLMELRRHKSAIIERLKQQAAPTAPPNSAPSAPPVSGAHGL